MQHWSLLIFLQIKIAGFIADAPATAKALNVIQFNGYYGCFKCLNPGSPFENRVIFEHSITTQVRTNERYQRQVNQAILSRQPFEGILY